MILTVVTKTKMQASSCFGHNNNTIIIWWQWWTKCLQLNPHLDRSLCAVNENSQWVNGQSRRCGLLDIMVSNIIVMPSWHVYLKVQFSPHVPSELAAALRKWARSNNFIGYTMNTNAYKTIYLFRYYTLTVCSHLLTFLIGTSSSWRNHHTSWCHPGESTYPYSGLFRYGSY